MKIKMDIFTYFLLLALCCGYCSCVQNDVISPAGTPPSGPTVIPPDSSLPNIPDPIGPSPITDLESPRKTLRDSPTINRGITLEAVNANADGETFSFFVPNIDSIFDVAADSMVKFESTSFLPLQIRHQRFWLNLGSRLIGPGTSYSLELSWTEGVIETVGEEFSASISASVSAEVEFGAPIGAKAKVSATLSTQLGKTFDSSVAINSEKAGKETQAVEGKDGVNRVYTVWQLCEEFVFIFIDGEGKQQQLDVNDTRLLDAAKRFLPLGGRLGPILLPVLTQGTPSIAQSTMDYPISKN